MAALRGLKNVVGNYSIGELKVREATTNETWGPTTSQLAEISDITHQLLHFHEVMSMIEKRLNDKGKNFRHVAKALLVLDYVIKTGSERVIQYWKDKLYIINTLKDFQFTDKEAKDQGRIIRDRAKQITVLINDNELLLAEREKALETKKKFHSGELVPASSSDVTSRSWEPERKNLQGNIAKPGSQPGSTPNLSADIKAALPTNRGEEDLQLQLAIALSKEEKDTKEKKVADEDSQLKSVLQISKTETDQKLTPGMIAPPPGSRTVEPWQSLPEPSQGRAPQEPGDPWGGGAPPPSQELMLGDQQDVSDPWTGELRGKLDSPVPETDLWGDLTSAPTGSPALKPVNLTNEIVMGPDPWAGFVKPADSGEVALLDRPISPPKSSALPPPADPNTVESEFLGQNAKLVNLDALVDLGRAPAAGSGQEGNPFAMLPPDTSSKPPASNPFLANVSPRPTLNQMRDTSKPDPLQDPLIPPAFNGHAVAPFSTAPAPAVPGQSPASELASIFQNAPAAYPPAMFPPAAGAPQSGQRSTPDYSGLSGLTTTTSGPYTGFSTGTSGPSAGISTGTSGPYAGFSTGPTGTSVPYTGFSTGTSQPGAGFPNFSTGQTGTQGHPAGFGPLEGTPGVNTGTAAPHSYGGNSSFPQSSNPFF